MNIIFLLSRPLGERCLIETMKKAEEWNVQISGCVTLPDDEQKWWDDDINEMMRKNNIPRIEYERLKEHDFDLGISILFWKIINKKTLSLPTIGFVNLHQAPLPRYRGCNSFSHAVQNARKDDHWKYGTTLHWIDEGIDTGPIIEMKEVPIKEEDTNWDLYKRTENASYELFKKWLPRISKAFHNDDLKSIPREPQGDKVYYYPRNSLENKEVDIDMLLHEPVRAYDFIRSVDFPPFEPAYIKINGRKIYLSLDYRKKSK